MAVQWPNGASAPLDDFLSFTACRRDHNELSSPTANMIISHAPSIILSLRIIELDG